MRTKEEAHDYRYFPEPDLVPFVVEKNIIEDIGKTIPELPEAKYNRFLADYALSEYDANILIQDKSLAHFFEKCTKTYDNSKKICNWISGSLLQELNARKVSISQTKITPEHFTSIIQKVEAGGINNLAGKDILKLTIDSGANPEDIIKDKGLAQVSDNSFLEEIVDEILSEKEDIVEQIKSGKENAIGFLIGMAMKKSKGKANPKLIDKIIKRRLLND